MAWKIWIAVFVVLIVIEAATMALTTIWFAGGALAAIALSLMDVGKNGQLAVFFLVSCALLFFTRPFVIRHVNRNTVKTNVEDLVGKKARITSDVDNDLSAGTAVVGGQEWSARSADGTPIRSGEMVRIESVSGVKLMVRKMEEI